MLTTDNRDGSALQRLNMALRRCAGTEAKVLLAQSRGDFAPPLRRIFQSRGNSLDFIQSWGMAVETRNFGKIIDQMEKELGLVRQAAKRYRGTAHGRFDDTCRLWLQQSTGTWRTKYLPLGRRVRADGSDLAAWN